MKHKTYFITATNFVAFTYRHYQSAQRDAIYFSKGHDTPYEIWRDGYDGNKDKLIATFIDGKRQPKNI